MKLARLLIATVSVELMLAGIPTMLLTGSPASTQVGTYSKAVVGDHIRKVEDGVDQFRDYLDKRGDDVQSSAQAAQNSGAKAKRERANPANTEARKEQAQRTDKRNKQALESMAGFFGVA